MTSNDSRVLVVGAGSIGARHARNLVSAGASVDVMDPDANRAAQVEVAAAVPFDLDRLGGYDGIAIASPTLHHATHLQAALATDATVFVEKPLVAHLSELDAVEGPGSGRVMVGFNLRLHEPVRAACEMVHTGRVGTVRAVRLWFGSWLPDWRPDVDYRTTYSARADMGGGVLNDAIHEIDLLLWLLGPGSIDVHGAIVGRFGPLEIDVEDTVKALMTHSSGTTAELSLDYLSRRYRRGFEVFGDDATLRVDWARAVLEVEDAEGIEQLPAATPVDRSYELEAAAFLDFIRLGTPPPVGLAGGIASVQLAAAIRRAGT